MFRTERSKRLERDSPDIKSGRSLEFKLDGLCDQKWTLFSNENGWYGESGPYFVEIAH